MCTIIKNLISVRNELFSFLTIHKLPEILLNGRVLYLQPINCVHRPKSHTMGAITLVIIYC